MKMTFFWGDVLYSLTVYYRFRGARCLHPQDDRRYDGKFLGNNSYAYLG